MKTFGLSRRIFLKSGLAAAAAAALAPRESWSSAGAWIRVPGAPPPSWTEKPMRWAQLTLVEDDPGKFDPSFWFHYFRRTRSDAVCLSGGGCVAYYPTQVPFHHRSRWLGDRDVLGDLIAGCRKLGMVVIVRTDPHATYDDVEQAHPDWIAVDADGNRRRHWASPDMWVTCGLGPYNFEFMTQVKREIMSRYRVDGIFINRWDGSGMCYCEHCRQNFRAASGLALPRTEDPQDPARRAYMLWRQERLFDLWQTWDRAVREINPDSCVIPNTGGGATSSLDMRKIGELAPTLMADRQARHGLMAPWAIGMNAKEYRATMGDKPIVGIFSVGVEEPYRWKDSVQSSAEIRLWVADLVANGMRPWFTKFGAVLRDERWLKPVEDIYRRLAGWERYLRNERPLARVGLVYSQQTAWFVGSKIQDHIHGWYQALIEARLPFELVHDRLLDRAHLGQFKTLILPSVAALSEAQCRQIEEFVRAGGSVIATHETSLRDEWGKRRDNFGLANLFGVNFAGKIDSHMQNAYLRLEHDAHHQHPLLRGLEDAPRIIHGTARVEVEPRDKSTPAPLTLIPSYPDLPMEMVYPRVARTQIAQVFLREESGGRVVYFPWDIDRTFWEVLSPDHGKLLRNAVEWATHEPAPVIVTGPGVLDVTLWRQKNSLTVHLVNLTNPMMMKGPIRELIPVGEEQVRVRLPNGAKVNRVRLLAAQQTPRVQHHHTELAISVPSILDPGSRSWLYSTLHELSALGLLWYILLRRSRSISDLGVSWNNKDLVRSALVWAGGTGAFLAVYTVIYAAGMTSTTNSTASARVGRMLFGPEVSAMAIIFAFINPFFEELIVRAYLMTEVQRLTNSVSKAVLLSALVQMSYHFYQGAPMAFAEGAAFLVFSIYYARTNRITPVILAHLYMDVFATLAFMVRHR